MPGSLDLSRVFTSGGCCQACGAPRPDAATRCPRCGTDTGEDEQPFDVLLSEPRMERRTGKPLEESRNFVQLMRAAAGIEDGSVSEAEYRQVVGRMRALAETAIRALEAPAVAKKLADEPLEARDIWGETLDAMRDLLAGVEMLTAYQAGREPSLLKAGAALAERAFVMLDRLEERALTAQATLD